MLRQLDSGSSNLSLRDKCQPVDSPQELQSPKPHVLGGVHSSCHLRMCLRSAPRIPLPAGSSSSFRRFVPSFLRKACTLKEVQEDGSPEAGCCFAPFRLLPRRGRAPSRQRTWMPSWSCWSRWEIAVSAWSQTPGSFGSCERLAREPGNGGAEGQQVDDSSVASMPWPWLWLYKILKDLK